MGFYRRRLPHWHARQLPLFVTFRLAGSLPRRPPPPYIGNSGAKFTWLDRQDDLTRSGPRWLAEPAIADSVVATLHRVERELGLYHLLAYAVMPNHVHLLFSPLVAPSQILRIVKGATAHEANRRLARRGQPFWQHESYDHLARLPGEVDRIRQYIEMNPVRAGLAERPESWLWSSAYVRAARSEPAPAEAGVHTS